MTRLERVIEAVKERRKGSKSWIYNENHEIADNVMVGDVLIYLKSLKDYEINVTDKWIEKFLKNERAKHHYTYNWNANISNDISFCVLETGHLEEIVAFCVHVGYDARVGFTEWFVCKFEYETMFEIEGSTQYKYFGPDDRYCADINIFSDCYNVYDYKTETDSEHWTIELEELLKELKELEVA